MDDVYTFAVDTEGKAEEVQKAIQWNIPKSNRVTSVGGHQFVAPPYNMDYMLSLFDFNSTHKFCIELKTNLICGIGYEVKKTAPKKVKDFLKRPNTIAQDSFIKICKKLRLDYEIFGRYALEIVRSGDRLAFYHVPAQNVYVRQKKGSIYVEKYLLKTEMGSFIEYEPYSFLGRNGRFLLVSDHYNPISQFYGVPNYISSINAIVGNDTISRYMLNFFSNNARPDYFVIITGTQLNNEQKDELKRNLSGVKGVENAHRAAALSLGADTAKVEIKEVSKVVDENFRNTKLDNRDEIAQIHGVPPKILGIASAGSLGSGNEAIGALKILVECIINAEKTEFEDLLNKVLAVEFNHQSDDIFSFNELSLINEKDLAIVHKTYLDMGVISVNEARLACGMLPLNGKEYDEIKRIPASSHSLEINPDDMTNLDPTKDITQTNV